MGQFRIAFIADICGRPGRQAAAHLIKPLREERQVDMIIANVENAAGGFGVTPEMSQKFFSYGVDVQTSGNHIWDRVQILEYIAETPRLLRPANYPRGAPGSGYTVMEFGEHKVAVINLMGRTFMPMTDCPFRKADSILRKIPDVKTIFIDFHAEATSEKQALAHYLDGKVSAVIGTHTHVPTADERILERGTAYLTDAGMTGPTDSIIGMDKGPSLGRFLTGMPKRFSTASGDVRMMGVIVCVNSQDGSAESIERFSLEFDLSKHQSGSSEQDDA